MLVVVCRTWACPPEMNVASGASFGACQRANATSEISILFLLLASPDDLLNACYQLGNTPIGIVSFIVSRVISKYQSTE